MSSIAYITEPRNIEHSRLSGNQTMVLWRLDLRKFSRFGVGDLVFFIDNRTRHPYTSEKGIIGYGRCSDIRNMSPKQTWDHYEAFMGYRSYDSFKRNIHKQLEGQRLPSQIQSLRLDDVAFFQSPIFLSEINISLSNHLGSYIYVERDDKDVSHELLDIVNKVGFDKWMSSQNINIRKEALHANIKEQNVRDILSKVDYEFNVTQKRILKNHTGSVASKNINYKYSNDIITIYLPMTHKRQTWELLGLKSYLEVLLKDETVKFIVLTNLPFEKHLLMPFQDLNVMLEHI